MKKRTNRLDEMQEQKLLQIEHNGCWLAFWGLGIALIVQRCIGADFRSVIAEWIVFMCLSLYIVIACVKNGIWDRTWTPAPKMNLFAGLIAGVISGGIFFYTSYTEYHAFWGSVATGVFIMGLTAAICFVLLSLIAILYRKRVSQLETEEQDNRHEKDEKLF